MIWNAHEYVVKHLLDQHGDSIEVLKKKKLGFLKTGC